MARDTGDGVPPAVLEAFGFEGAFTEPLAGGQVNRHWLATREGESRVFRCYHAMRSAAAAAWEQTLVEFAGGKAWPVATALKAANGATVFEHKGRLWSAAPYVEGEHPSGESVAMQHIYGRLLARLHQDLADFPLDGQRPGCGKIWELDVWVAPAGAGSFNDLLSAFGRDHADLAASVRRYRYRNLRELSRLHYPDLPDHPIHGDWGPSNLLWKDGQLSGVLDFDWCRRDALACDLASAFPWDNMADDRVRGLVEGYQEVRPLDDAEWSLLPALTRAQLLFFIAFRLVEWRMEGGERPAESIYRTVSRRLPQTEMLARKLDTLRGARAHGRG